MEEPPPHVVFILATTDPQQLLDTVVSRCQRFDFKMIPVRTVYERLRFVAEQEGVAVPDSSLMVIAREGGGSMRDAQSLLDQVLSFSGESVTEDEVAEILGFIDRSILYEVLEAALEGDAAAAIEALSKVALFGYDVRTFSEQLLEAVRNVHVVLQIRDGGDLLDLPDDEIARLGKLADSRNSETLQRHFDVLAASVDSLHRSEQPLLLLEMAVVKMASIRPFVAVQTLVDRLEALERRLRKASLSAPPSGGPPRPTEGRGGKFTPPRPTREAHRVDSEVAPTSKPVAKVSPQPPAAAKPTKTAKHEASTAQETPPAPPVPAAAIQTEKSSVADMLFGFESSSGGGATEQVPSPPAPKAVTKTETPPQSTPPVSASSTPAEAETEYVEPSRPSSPGPKVSATPSVSTTPPAPSPEESAESEVGTASVFDLPKFDVEAFDAPRASRKAERVELPADRPDPAGSELCDATRWRRFVHRLGQQEKMGITAAPLAMACFLGTEGRTISLGFLSTLPMRQMDEISTSAALQNALHQEFGEGTTLSWMIDRDGKSGRSLIEELRLQRAERRAELEERASNNEAVERVKDTFPGAKIADVFLPETLEITHVR